MPLHLLGKKSWNVYNADNIARVRRDEEAARAREQAEEQRLQEIDAERRLAILRGDVPPPLPPVETGTDARDHDAGHDYYKEPRAGVGSEHRRKRKRAGEDDTDIELRVARERTSVALVKPPPPPPRRSSSSNAPLTDAAGHIDLFGGESQQQKNPEAEAEKAKKKRQAEDQYTVRFSNAAGFNRTSVAEGAWYAEGRDRDGGDAPGRDVWGNEDPGRKGRDDARIVANDPLAAMKKGAARVREVEKERRAVHEEREKEVRQLRKEERRREKRRRRHGEEEDELEGFSLDGPSLDQELRSKRRYGDEKDERDDTRRRHHRSHHDDARRSEHRHHHHHRSDHHRHRTHHDSKDGRSDNQRDHRKMARTDH